MTIELIANILSLATVIAAFVAILVSNHDNRQLLRTTIYLEFSRRYQEIMLSIPENGVPTAKHIMLFFDLCSEEYRLYRSRQVPQKTWELWVEGMSDTLSRDIDTYRAQWLTVRAYYNTDNFNTFFDSLFPAPR